MKRTFVNFIKFKLAQHEMFVLINVLWNFFLFLYFFLFHLPSYTNTPTLHYFCTLIQCSNALSRDSILFYHAICRMVRKKGSKYVSLADYCAMGNSEVSMKEGETVILMKLGCAGWWYVRVLGKRFFIFLSLFCYFFLCGGSFDVMSLHKFTTILENDVVFNVWSI